MPRLSKYSSGYEGKRYFRWTVFCYAYSRPEGRKSSAFYWICRCTCGEWRAVNIRCLERNGSKSCGCWRVEQTTQQLLKHGHGRSQAGGGRTPEYTSWYHAIQRTTNPNHNKSWHRYGGRGIVVCTGFRHFPNFLRLLGLKPTSRHSVDRINNDGHYSCGECQQCVRETWPMNCRWATPLEQAANTSLRRDRKTGKFMATGLCQVRRELQSQEADPRHRSA